MSHELDQSRGKDRTAFFSARQPAWHGLGKIVENALTSEEAIIAAELDYVVEKRSIFAKGISSYPNLISETDHLVLHNKKQGIRSYYQATGIKSHFATVRTDTETVLGVVGKRYEILQNVEAFKILDDIIGDKLAIFETAGAVFNGAVVFMTAKLPENIKVNGNDLIENYLLITNGHDGTKSLQIAVTPIRVVCNNTLRDALKNNCQSVRFNHTTNIRKSSDKLKYFIQDVNDNNETVKESFHRLMDVKVNEEMIEWFLDQLYPPMSDGKYSTKTLTVRDVIKEYLEKGPGQADHKDNLYGLYNAVTGYYQNVKKFKNEEDMFNKINFGDAKVKSLKAWSAVNILAGTSNINDLLFNK